MISFIRVEVWKLIRQLNLYNIVEHKNIIYLFDSLIKREKYLKAVIKDDNAYIEEFNLILKRDHFEVIPTNTNCIVCDKDVKTTDYNHNNYVEIGPGFGSIYDGELFITYVKIRNNRY